MNQQAERSPVLVMGVGNMLRGDDGFGVAVLDEVGNRNLPGNVDLLDAGTSIIDLMEELHGRRKVVVIDAVRGGQSPGVCGGGQGRAERTIGLRSDPGNGSLGVRADFSGGSGGCLGEVGLRS